MLKAAKLQPKPASKDQNDGILLRLITKIVDRVQITVRNVHVRYEDLVTNPAVRQFVVYHAVIFINEISARFLGGCYPGAVEPAHDTTNNNERGLSASHSQNTHGAQLGCVLDCRSASAIQLGERVNTRHGSVCMCTLFVTIDYVLTGSDCTRR